VAGLDRFRITHKWPAKFPDRIQLYSSTTPNGVKAAIMLEETGLPYEPHRVELDRKEQLSPEFVAVFPNNKIPALIDPNGPSGPLALFESGAILVYLADKAGRLMPHEAARRYEALQWVFFQVGGIGPMFGQVGYFHHYAGKDLEDKRPRDRYVEESRRLLGVLDRHLTNRAWMLGDDYSIADIAIFPWVNHLVTYYGARELVRYEEFREVRRATDLFLARPAVMRGLRIPARS
jgi:GST-like protein